MVEIDTPRGMALSFHTHSRGNTNKLVYRLGIVQGNCDLDEVLENVGGHEAYSFTDGFSGYHHIMIAQEERYKTTFVKKWGFYQYTIMPFGLKNAPTIFSRVVIVAFKEFIHQLLEVYLDD
jgi:hypothetical protein